MGFGNLIVMALLLSALELVMEHHFYPRMKRVSPVLRSGAVFERRLRRHLAAVECSPWLRVRASDYPALSASRFWKEHPHSVPWAIFGVASRGCRDICRARLRHLDLARIPAMSSSMALASLGVVISTQYYAVDERGESFFAASNSRSEEVRAAVEEMDALQSRLREIMIRLRLAARGE